jgi:hypothetical protein
VNKSRNEAFVARVPHRLGGPLTRFADEAAARDGNVSFL